jgi:hypothetical protein
MFKVKPRLVEYSRGSRQNEQNEQNERFLTNYPVDLNIQQIQNLLERSELGRGNKFVKFRLIL